MSAMTAVEIEPWNVQGELLFRGKSRHPGSIGNIEDFPTISAWLDGLGVSADDVFAFSLYRAKDGRHLLAVAEDCKDNDGHKHLNFATGEPAEKSRVFDLGTEPTWPDVLNRAPYVPARSTFA